METQKALLYSQLQNGLASELSKAPAVSGARNYEELCKAVKNEERIRQSWRNDSSIKEVDKKYLLNTQLEV